MTDNEYFKFDDYIKYMDKISTIKINKYSSRYRFQEITKLKSFGDNIINKDECIYIKKEYVYRSINTYCESINVGEASRIIYDYQVKTLGYDKTDSNNIRVLISKKLNVYKIKLFDENSNFINKSDLNLILKGIDEIREKECITKEELLVKANNQFKGNNFGYTEKRIFSFIKDNELEFIDKSFIGNFYLFSPNLYPKKTVNMVMDNLKKYIIEKKVRLINISVEEYLSLTNEQFENFEVLDFNMLKKIAGYCIESNLKFKNINSTFKDTNVKVIWIHKGKIYVSKREYEEYIDFKNNYVGSEYFQKLNIDFRGRVARNNGIEVRNYKSKNYIKKEDVDRYIEIDSYNKEFLNSESLYDKLFIKIKYFPNKKENNYPIFMLHFKDFVKQLNRTNKTLKQLANLYSLYNIILDNIQKDLEKKNEEENNKLFNKIIRIYYRQVESKRIIIQFNNYLIKNKNFNINKISDVSEKNQIVAYEKENFIKLLIRLIEIVADKKELKKLYRNWNLSSVISYIFMHYCVAWRKMDLVKQLPTPNIRLIDGITDGESFIKWLESGNEITNNLAYEICKNIEEKTKRLRLKANKNNVELSCVISSALAKEVATLLCINEANREIHFKNVKRFRYKEWVFNKSFVEHNKMQKLLLENFKFDLSDVLGGDFNNIRMNKGFLTLVKEKSEELDLAYSYYYAQVLRGHKARYGDVSETTKIYLQKDISNASVLAFATGTMGSIAYTLLELVDNKIEINSNEYKIEAINNLNMTPYTIEKNIKVISNKISAIKNEIDRYFKRGGYKEGLLEELLYGQNSYGIEERTKCLLKITRSEEGISRIKSENYSKEVNSIKWCPYNRKSCIGCEYMIALRYFIYEFDRRFNKVLNDLEASETNIDREIAIGSINEIYIPLINDLSLILGDEISQVIDTKRYLKLVESI